MSLFALAQAAVTADLVDRLPIMGGALVLISIVGIVTRLWLGSETRHRAELERIGAAHKAELERIGSAHDAQVRRLGRRMDELQAEVANLRAELAAERRTRWRAEDVAARRRRMSEGGGEGA